MIREGTNWLFLLLVQFGCAMLLLFAGGVLLLLVILKVDCFLSHLYKFERHSVFFVRLERAFGMIYGIFLFRAMFYPKTC